MGLKPISITEAIRKAEPRWAANRSRNTNRFEVLRSRDDSSGPGNRDRSASTKRKASEADSQSTNPPKRYIQASTLPSSLSKNLEELQEKLGKALSLQASLASSIKENRFEPALENVLKIITNFFEISNSIQTGLVEALATKQPTHTVRSGKTPTTSAGNSQPDSCTEVSDSEGDEVNFRVQPLSYNQVTATVRRRPLANKTIQPSGSKQKVDPKLQGFQDAIRAAEKSTLIFNLNLGNTKTLNQTSILSKASLALMAAAAEVEGKTSNHPSEEAIEALDDVISIAENATLYGKCTKPTKARSLEGSQKNGTYYSMPIRYEFKDKDSRIAAETVLRERCKVECSTPYPAILRNCIKQVVDHIRDAYPGQFVRVNVDTDKFCLRASRRSPDGWYKYDKPIPLPDIAYNVHARSLPEDMVKMDLPELFPSMETAEASTGPPTPSGPLGPPGVALGNP